MHIKQLARLPGMCRYSMNMNCLGNSKGRGNLFELGIAVISLRHRESVYEDIRDISSQGNSMNKEWRQEGKWSSRTGLTLKGSKALPLKVQKWVGHFPLSLWLRGAVGMDCTKAKEAKGSLISAVQQNPLQECQKQPSWGKLKDTVYETKQ